MKSLRFIQITALAAILLLIGFCSNRTTETKRKLSVSQELQELGEKISKLHPTADEQQIIAGTNFTWINPLHLEFIEKDLSRRADQPSILYREPMTTYTYHMDGHVEVRAVHEGRLDPLTQCPQIKNPKKANP